MNHLSIRKSVDFFFFFFWQNAPRILFSVLALRLSVRRFQIPLKGLSVVETLATFGTDPFLIRLRLFASVDSSSIFLTCLVPRPQYYASVIRFGSRGPGRKVWPRQKSEK